MKYLKSKKRIIFLILLVLVVLLGIFYFLLLQDREQDRAPVFFDETIFDKVFSRKEPIANCFYEDSIEFYYYEPVPEDEYRNNKFGLYIYSEEKYVEIADDLVNTNGGAWGYVLIPYSVKDKNHSKWRELFSKLLDKELIPVIQLWDVDINNYEEETKKAAEFLNNFLWPTKTWYISVYNEPNDDSFWFGEANPEQYAEVLDYTIKTFKKENENFFIMNGALNVSAPSNSQYIDAFTFLQRMNNHKPGIFNKLDGWASHPYPQPEFSGSPYATGRWSIRAYEDELNYLKNYAGLEKDLPVFITETGWVHAEGDVYNSKYHDQEKVAEYFKIAYQDVWLPDDKVMAVMPFTVRYEPPFDHFSWIDQNDAPYAQYKAIQGLKKVSGNPSKLETDNMQSIKCNE